MKNDSKFVKAFTDDGREMKLELDLTNGIVLSRKLMRKKKNSKPINVADDFTLGVKFN